MAAIFKYLSTISSITLPARQDNPEKKRAEVEGAKE